LGIGIAGRAHAVEGALDALLEHGDGDGVEAGDRRALTLVAEADHDHRAGLADGTEGLPDVLVLDDADADDRRVKRDFPAQKINQKWYGDGTEIKTGQGKLYLLVTWNLAGGSATRRDDLVPFGAGFSFSQVTSAKAAL
jgi:hypothetical protein